MKFSENEAQRVYGIFSDTEYGKRLKKAARYNRFRPIGYSVKYWGRLMGRDVNNLQHMRHTISVARWFVVTENTIKSGTFTQRDALLLGITAALHDQAEAIIGDVPHGRKTMEQREQEAQVLQNHEEVFEPHLKGIALKLYRIGRDKIAFSSPEERLPGAFKTIELICFVENALHALRQTEYLKKQLPPKKAEYFGIFTEDDRQRLIIALERLSTEVLGSGVIEQLISCGDRFPSAHIYLNRHARQIEQGITSAHMSAFEWYSLEDPWTRPGERERRIKQFYQQKDLWESWSCRNTDLRRRKDNRIS